MDGRRGPNQLHGEHEAETLALRHPAHTFSPTSGFVACSSCENLDKETAAPRYYPLLSYECTFNYLNGCP
ncbi:hypothetical protein MTO96_025606 [Rhipicephalus appendiculatus]